MTHASNQGVRTPQNNTPGHGLSPAGLVDEYLRILMIPDPAGVQRLIAPGLRIRFTGGREMGAPAECAAFNASRYAWVKKRIERTEVVAGGTPEETVVYSLGTLYGAWPDGTPFEGNRYVDRYVVRHGLITRMDVWNDSAEWLLDPPLRARRAEAGGAMTAVYGGLLPAHGRFGYQPITRRPGYAWPNGARLAVYLGFNLEHFAFGEGLGAAIGPVSPEPDVLNYTWREYGNRVGAWRCLELFDQLALPSAALVNTALYDHCPELVAACAARGDEIVGHGHTNAERQGGWPEAAERRLLESCRDRIARESGSAPRGWLSPWISESRLTPDLLAEAGYRYTLDWCHDDQPLPMRTRAGQVLWSVPYPQELNDIPAIIARRMDAAAFAQMIVDNLDEMLGQCAGQPLVMGIALHPYIVGQPYRLRHLRRALEHLAGARDRGEVWLATPGAICGHAQAELADRLS